MAMAAQSGTDDIVEAALSAASKRFEEANPKSKKQHEIAAGVLPGGNTRTLLHTSPFPLSMRCGKDCYVWDEDDHKQVVPIQPSVTMAFQRRTC
jgi:glutamate-1-semialdehyde 2,1-aminomutase